MYDDNELDQDEENFDLGEIDEAIIKDEDFDFGEEDPDKDH